MKSLFAHLLIITNVKKTIRLLNSRGKIPTFTRRIKELFYG